MILIYIHGKFNTASRRNAGVVISGNSAFVSENSFKAYGNAQNYWIFSNDKGSGNNNISASTPSYSGSTVNYTRYVATQRAPLNVRNSAGGSVIGSLSKGTTVQVVEVSGGWSRITSPVNGWVSSGYLSATSVSTASNISYSTTIGTIKKLSRASTLYSNSNLTGTQYSYKANTTITILQNVSSTVDRVRVNTTGRIAYINNSNYTNVVISKSKSTSVGQYKRFKAKTTLYSNSNLTGTKYSYLPQTQVKIVKNVSSNVDYVYVVKTKRYAYVRSDSYR